MGLTCRQIEVSRAVARGFSDKEVGRALGISEGTVGSHLKVIFLRLGVGSRVELAALVVRAGL